MTNYNSEEEEILNADFLLMEIERMLVKNINGDFENLDKICRICLRRQADLKLSEHEDYDTFLILQRFWGLKANLTKKLFPPNICEDCSQELKLVNSFIIKLDSSTDILHRSFEPQIKFLQHNYKVANKKLPSNINEEDEHKADLEEIIIIADINDNKYHDSEECDDVKDKIKSEDITNSDYPSKSDQSNKLAVITVDGSYKCNLCNIEIKEKESLHSHFALHTEQKYQCELCGKIYKDNTLLKNHQESSHKHHKLKCKSNKEIKNTSGQFACNECEKIFSVKSNMIRHQSIAHKKHRRFSCDICHETFTIKNSLKYHLYIHSNDKPFKCNMCTKAFRQPNALIRHKNTKHVREKNFECDICFKKLKSKLTLEKHQANKHLPL